MSAKPMKNKVIMRAAVRGQKWRLGDRLQVMLGSVLGAAARRRARARGILRSQS
jgi:hypothetical protein